MKSSIKKEIIKKKKSIKITKTLKLDTKSHIIKELLHSIYSTKDPTRNQKIINLIDASCLNNQLTKNKTLLLEICNLLNLDIKKMEKLDNNDICIKLQSINLDSTSIFSPYLYINNFMDFVHYILYDVKRPGTFIRDCKKLLEGLLINELVYKSLFDKKISKLIEENALNLLKVNSIIDIISQLQYEIGTVIQENGSSFIKDLSRREKRVKSKIFFGSLNIDQLSELKKYYFCLSFIFKEIVEFKKKIEKIPGINQELNRLDMIEKENRKIEREEELLDLRNQELKIQKQKLNLKEKEFNVNNKNIYEIIFDL